MMIYKLLPYFKTYQNYKTTLNVNVNVTISPSHVMFINMPSDHFDFKINVMIILLIGNLITKVIILLFLDVSYIVV